MTNFAKYTGYVRRVRLTCIRHVMTSQW